MPKASIWSGIMVEVSMSSGSIPQGGNVSAGMLTPGLVVLPLSGG
jgi:hypothetical protein